MILQAPINSLGYGRVGYEVAKRLGKALEGIYVPYCPPEGLTIYPIGQPEPDLYEELQQYDWRNVENEDFIVYSKDLASTQSS